MQTQSVASAGRRGKASAAAGKPRPSSAPAAIPAGLKISFKPAELKKTTEKNVALQVVLDSIYASFFQWSFNKILTIFSRFALYWAKLLPTMPPVSIMRYVIIDD